MWNRIGLSKYNPTATQRRCWKDSKTACLKFMPAVWIDPFRTFMKLISLIFKRLTMWSKSVGKKYLKCLDKYCIIWSHKWYQDVTRFLLNKWKITESMPPQPHTSGVNIPHEQTQRQIWKSIKGSGYTLGPLAPTFSSPRRLIFPLSVPLLSGDRSPFLHYQCDSHWSLCSWDHTVRFLLCVSDVSSRLLLLKKYTKSHDDAAASHPGTLSLPWRWEINFSSTLDH